MGPFVGHFFKNCEFSAILFQNFGFTPVCGIHVQYTVLKIVNIKTLISCADLGEGPQPQLFWRILQKIYEKNTEMNVQMLFSGPLFPELGSQSPTF